MHYYTDQMQWWSLEWLYTVYFSCAIFKMLFDFTYIDFYKLCPVEIMVRYFSTIPHLFSKLLVLVWFGGVGVEFVEWKFNVQNSYVSVYDCIIRTSYHFYLFITVFPSINISAVCIIFITLMRSLIKFRSPQRILVQFGS